MTVEFSDCEASLINNSNLNASKMTYTVSGGALNSTQTKLNAKL